MKPNDFIAAIAPAAKISAQSSGVPASFIIAQAALESAWGSSKLAVEGFNLFGIKADASWKGPTVAMPTAEVVNGRRITVTAAFRRYDGWLGSIEDQARFLRGNKRYAAAFQTKNAQDFARAVAAAGYATDPDYAQKLISTMVARNLQQFDNG